MAGEQAAVPDASAARAVAADLAAATGWGLVPREVAVVPWPGPGVCFVDTKTHKQRNKQTNKQTSKQTT